MTQFLPKAHSFSITKATKELLNMPSADQACTKISSHVQFTVIKNMVLTVRKAFKAMYSENYRTLSQTNQF